jgi:hypothetical protein
LSDDDIEHAVQLAAADDEHGQSASTLGPDQAGNMLEVVSVVREVSTEVVIHAMKMRPIYEPLVRETGDADG